MIKLINKGIAIRYRKKALLITLDKTWNAYPASHFYSYNERNEKCEIKVYNLGLFVLVTNKKV